MALASLAADSPVEHELRVMPHIGSRLRQLTRCVLALWMSLSWRVMFETAP